MKRNLFAASFALAGAAALGGCHALSIEGAWTAPCQLCGYPPAADAELSAGGDGTAYVLLRTIDTMTSDVHTIEFDATWTEAEDGTYSVVGSCVTVDGAVVADCHMYDVTLTCTLGPVDGDTGDVVSMSCNASGYWMGPSYAWKRVD